MNTTTDFRSIFGVDTGSPTPGSDSTGRFVRIYLESEPLTPDGATVRRYLMAINPGSYKVFGAWKAELLALAGGGSLQFHDPTDQPVGDPFPLVTGEAISTLGAAGPTGRLDVDPGGLVLVLNAPESDLQLLGCPTKPCDKPNAVPEIAPLPL